MDVKGQGHTESMTVCDTSYHGDTLACITKYDYAKGQIKGLKGHNGIKRREYRFGHTKF